MALSLKRAEALGQQLQQLLPDAKIEVRESLHTVVVLAKSIDLSGYQLSRIAAMMPDESNVNVGRSGAGARLIFS